MEPLPRARYTIPFHSCTPPQNTAVAALPCLAGGGLAGKQRLYLYCSVPFLDLFFYLSLLFVSIFALDWAVPFLYIFSFPLRLRLRLRCTSFLPLLCFFFIRRTRPRIHTSVHIHARGPSIRFILIRLFIA
ncbi:hypothetical protein C8R44DRAFT_814465 [Mycena epipterygia]|nr:hypothetical protein C8R44DRAFT_814465 [Mycena epipterygia]